ncbi:MULTISPECIES: peptidylprolyl isomerase [Methylobacterium]|uniref:Parvulin-like PPIase n=3 Tax=Pseudomonadota TaxID=1224 RepID=A0ABQ4T1M5_9HYPH|nr:MULTISPECIES: peptidylprolyl isomerase [Methylobacterium]PIU08421.1 MAG: peptidylprolyl isomerase [Methylobacterium sp. CG09_land_8_20_14_0_10_71_15]PIU11710.1 MAG: peptidylprolyl isomerase [Methylobacterium sp. CG08_land_8_20_14_0_20_71_15]GBU18611.1 peptidylprolyl isomerase [Methylobacterium sp.]GJE08704.1 putative parvulin-type peptidyl-prolyl cis-trans isomerase [Methylobacterium jeotgali]
MPKPVLSLRASALALALSLPGGVAFAQAPTPAAPDTVVATVNGAKITQGDLAVAADDPALSLPGVDEEQKKNLLVDYMVDLRVGAQAAEAAKVGDTPEFKRKLAYFRDKLLLDEYLERESKKAATPEAAKALYDQTAKAMKPEEEVRARHILVDNEADAKAIAQRLKGGEDFAKVAAEVSKDPGSKTEGGDLGFFTKERMVAPFAEAAFALPVGQVSDPVKTQFGWHVIKVEEKRTKPVPSFSEMKDQVDQYLTRKAQQDIILKLREGAKVERVGAAATPAKPDEPKKP